MNEIYRGSEEVRRQSQLVTASEMIPNDRWNLPPRQPRNAYPNLSVLLGQRMGNDNRLVACSVEDMVLTDQTIAQNIVPNEHLHSPKVYVVAHPRERRVVGKHIEVRENNTQFLQMIGGGNWGLPLAYWSNTRQTMQDELSFDNHEVAGNHLLFMMTAPGIMQDAITVAANYGLDWRSKGNDIRTGNKGLLLSASDRGQVILPHNMMVDYEKIDAINVIDGISDYNGLPLLMDRLLGMQSSEERDTYIDYYAALSKLDMHKADSMIMASVPGDLKYIKHFTDREHARKTEMQLIQRDMIEIANFNLRFDRGQNMAMEQMVDTADEYTESIRTIAHAYAGDDLRLAA